MVDEVALVEQIYAALGRGDLGGVLPHLADDIEWFEAEGNPWWPGRPFVGPQEVVENVLARIPQDYEDFAVRVDRLVGLGGTVLMQGRYTGRGRATGRPLDAQVAHVWDVRDGRVVRWQQYLDTAQAREVLGA